MNFVESRPLFFVLGTAFLVVIGIVSAFNLPISLYPTVERPIVRVTVNLIEDSSQFFDRWGHKLENSLGEIEGVERVEGQYRQGRARYYVYFEWEIEPKQAKRDVATVSSFYQAQLPDNIDPIRVDFFDPSTENYVAIKSDKFTPTEVSTLVKESLIPRLESLNGVGRAWVSDKNQTFVNVKIVPQSLIDFGVSIDDVYTALERTRSDLRLGQIEVEEHGNITVAIERQLSGLEQLRNTTISSKAGSTVTIRDVANVDWSNSSDQRFFLYQQSEVTAVAVWPEPGANIYDLSTRFHEEIENFTSDVGEVFVLNSPLNFIKDAVFSLIIALAIGMALASLVVYLFYNTALHSILISLTMPIALCLTFMSMSLFDIGLNLISLGAMGISIGMVIDSAIIVVDSINKGLLSIDGQSADARRKAVSTSVKQVAPAVLTSNLTSIVVFLPLAFTAPFAASILSDTVFVVVCMLCAATFLSLVFIPSLFLFGNIRGQQGPRIFRAENSSGSSTLGKLISDKLVDRRNLSVVVACTTAVACALIISIVPGLLKTEIIAQPKAGIVDIGINFEHEGLSNAAKTESVESIRELIPPQVSDKIKYIYTDVRQSLAYLSLHLKSYKDSEVVLRLLRQILITEHNLDVEIEPWVTSSLKIEDKPDLKLLLTAPSIEQNRMYMDFLNQELKSNEAIENVKISPRNRTSNIVNLRINSDARDWLLSDQNLNSRLEELDNYLRYSVEPRKLFDIHLDSGKTDLKLSVEKSDFSMESLENLPFINNFDQLALRDIYDTELKTVWSEFSTTNGYRSYQLEIWFGSQSTDVNQFFADTKDKLLSKFELEYAPLVTEDTGLETREAIASLKTSLLFSIVVVFLVILFQFRKMVSTFIVMSVIPIAISGAFLSLLIFGSTISLNSMLGILILIGLSVNNSILLVNYFYWRTRDGTTAKTAIVSTIDNRFKPLVVTTITTVGAMIPIAIGFGPGKEILQPLGISISFGLLIAMVMTLVVVPALLGIAPSPHEHTAN